ncbi:hypothetical protein GMORB2_2413 [Geosmithia morbida]|uniref:Uncharacterized protein n=1 Tax=Geosmithia morbida TaxID=1094350 RepID=A0A9P4YQX1_9HYPO|nr:uncharacterized protein GMORB2_2413 [Geosmithia morbida]KAF4120927.1 hypothetical protein GMORB2_2413 [Geosmithia morbida]
MKFLTALTVLSGVASAAVISPPYPYPKNGTTVINMKRAHATDATLGSLLKAAAKASEMVGLQAPETKEEVNKLSEAISQFEKAVGNITVPDNMTSN